MGHWEAERDQYAERVFAHEAPELERGLAEGRQLSFGAAIAEALTES